MVVLPSASEEDPGNSVLEGLPLLPIVTDAVEGPSVGVKERMVVYTQTVASGGDSLPTPAAPPPTERIQKYHCSDDLQPLLLATALLSVVPEITSVSQDGHRVVLPRVPQEWEPRWDRWRKGFRSPTPLELGGGERNVGVVLPAPAAHPLANGGSGCYPPLPTRLQRSEGSVPLRGRGDR
jgi:hypothetical protein